MFNTLPAFRERVRILTTFPSGLRGDSTDSSSLLAKNASSEEFSQELWHQGNVTDRTARPAPSNCRVRLRVLASPKSNAA